MAGGDMTSDGGRLVARSGDDGEVVSEWRAPTTEESAYPFAVVIATILNVLAWFVLVGGQVLWLLSALGSDCRGLDCDVTYRVVSYLSITILSLVAMALMWGVSYGLLLLNRIEWNTRNAS